MSTQEIRSENNWWSHQPSFEGLSYWDRKESTGVLGGFIMISQCLEELHGTSWCLSLHWVSLHLCSVHMRTPFFTLRARDLAKAHEPDGIYPAAFHFFSHPPPAPLCLLSHSSFLLQAVLPACPPMHYGPYKCLVLPLKVSSWQPPVHLHVIEKPPLLNPALLFHNSAHCSPFSQPLISYNSI